FDKQYVCTRITVTDGPRNGAIEALDRYSIGSGNHQSFARASCIEGCLDFPDHFFWRYERFVVEVPATLGECLILELNRPCTGALEQTHRPSNVERVAVSGIGINNKIGANTIADHGNSVGNFVHRHKADIGSPKPSVGDGRSGNIESRKPRAFG